MTRVGLVDLSTSHPAIFAPLLAGMGMTVTAVLDHERAAAFPAAVAAGSLRELAGLCDVVMLLGPDWDTRLAQVTELVALGVPVFVDKPMAGTAGELRRLAELADGPARLDGGSALRVAPEARALAGVTQVDVACAGHPFYYGVHAVALATAVLGPGLVAARAEPGDVNRVLTGTVRHASGASAGVSVALGDTAGGFVATTPDLRVEPAAEVFYPALLADTLTRLTTSVATRPGRELVECELALLAMAWSTTHGGALVALADVPADFHPWRGDALHR